MNSALRQLLVVSAAIVAAMLTGGPGAAQEPGARRGDPTVTSPEVTADHRVTFRLKAPEAKAVTVSGDFGSDVEMRKSADGIWSATIGPLDPEMYVYYFTLDGVRLTDPSNPEVKIGYVTSTTTSLLTVPGDGPAFYDVQDVPHGEIRTLLYKSRSNGTTRELTVYIPPGYDEARNRRYPVLYLLHGFANDHHSWHRYAPTTFSTICSHKDESSPSWSSCLSGMEGRTSTAMAPGSRRKAPARSAETPPSTSATCSRTSFR